MTEKRMASIMFADIVGYSKMMENNQSETLKVLDKCMSIIEPIVTRFGGTRIKWIGDEIFCEFPLNEKAADCALEILKSLNTYNKDSKDIEILMRIGIHSGEIAVKQNDRYGNTVNVASRIVSQAPRGGIAISGNVYSELKSYPRFVLRKLRAKKLKNIEFKYGLYCIISGYEPKRNPNKYRFSVLFIAVFVIITLFISLETFDIYGNLENPVEIGNSDSITTIPETVALYLAEDKVTKFIDDVLRIKDVDKLLTFLDTKSRTGIIKYGNRNDFYNLNEKFVIILGKNQISDILLNFNDSFISVKYNKVLNSLASHYNNQRMIWIHVF